ncbi:DUF4236 domain-containing protein [Pseudonocardia pini]|uniref:DUF4236 domain-containing protein n=1 Tax=Pseudonocardia pini TaxID=2758030 RepID=UPI001C68CAEA|nr:DUF4236 domain-containing protein [Pseudonocardia pini]
MIRFRARKSHRCGPVRITVNQAGRVTWGLKVGPWSWSQSTGRHSLDTPGPGGFTWGGRKR